MKRTSNLPINGKRIYLREVYPRDVEKGYYRWMNDKETTQFLETRFEKWSVKKLRVYVRRIKSDPDSIFFAIVTKDGNEHIGNIKIGSINRIHKFADIGIIIGEKVFWGKGLATEAIKMVIKYAFGVLKLHKLTAGVYANNIGSIKAFRKAGFTVEGTRKSQYIHKGVYVDSVLLGIFKK